MGHSDAAERVEQGPGSLPQARFCRVVEIASDVAGEMTGRLLAQKWAPTFSRSSPVTRPRRPERSDRLPEDEQGPNRIASRFWYYKRVPNKSRQPSET